MDLLSTYGNYFQMPFNVTNTTVDPDPPNPDPPGPDPPNPDPPGPDPPIKVFKSGEIIYTVNLTEQYGSGVGTIDTIGGGRIIMQAKSL